MMSSFHIMFALRMTHNIYRGSHDGLNRNCCCKLREKAAVSAAREQACTVARVYQLNVPKIMYQALCVTPREHSWTCSDNVIARL